MSCRDGTTSKLVNAAAMINIELFVRLRAGKKLSQTGLAKAAGVSQQLIGEIEAGRVRSTKAIYKIAHILGTTASLLDPDIPVVESNWAKIQQELSELDPEIAAYLLERFANDIEFAKKRGK
jgi:transcriptional regulator with XRE-family HTH domain